jgi:RNA-directed DNA polymerase
MSGDVHVRFRERLGVRFPWATRLIVHCRSQKQLGYIERKIRARLTQCKLELCQEKTKRVYCKDSNRSGEYPIQSFDFLGYTFRPRSARDGNGKFFVSFSPAVSCKALKRMRLKIKQHPMIKGCFSLSIEELAKAINPMITGWINYYGKFRRSAMSALYDYINSKLIKWAQRKYKHLRRRKGRSGRWLRGLYSQNPLLFAHWRVWSWVAE